MGMLKYKGYSGSVEYSDENKCLFGKVQGLHGTHIAYVGYTIEEITTNFHIVIDDYLKTCKTIGVEPARPNNRELESIPSSDIHVQVTTAASTADTINNISNNKAVNNSPCIKRTDKLHKRKRFI